MTGLNPSTDTIMSITCLLTTHDLQLLEPHGFDAIIHHTPAQLSTMGPWCTTTHGASGLTTACLNSTTTAHTAAHSLLIYIKTHIPQPNTALLAGNSIHADKAFLSVSPWSVVLEHLHYRLFDVSAMKEMVRRWAPEAVLRSAPVKALKHTAREDVLESLAEARFYMGLLSGLEGNVNIIPRGTMDVSSKQGQEDIMKLSNNGNEDGDVAGTGQGFRTDVP
jgi:oligoribonuclease